LSKGNRRPQPNWRREGGDVKRKSSITAGRGRRKEGSASRKVAGIGSRVRLWQGGREALNSVVKIPITENVAPMREEEGGEHRGNL